MSLMENRKRIKIVFIVLVSVIVFPILLFSVINIVGSIIENTAQNINGKTFSQIQNQFDEFNKNPEVLNFSIPEKIDGQNIQNEKHTDNSGNIYTGICWYNAENEKTIIQERVDDKEYQTTITRIYNAEDIYAPKIDISDEFWYNGTGIICDITDEILFISKETTEDEYVLKNYADKETKANVQKQYIAKQDFTKLNKNLIIKQNVYNVLNYHVYTAEKHLSYEDLYQIVSVVRINDTTIYVAEMTFYNKEDRDTVLETKLEDILPILADVQFVANLD